MLAEPDLLNILSVDFLRGDPRTALQRPGTVAVTQATAARYFGREDPLGRTLLIDGRELEVTGVLADAPANTHLKYRFIVSLKDYPFKYTDQWRMTTIYTYIKLAAGVDAAAFALKMRDLTDRYSPPRPGFSNPDLDPHGGQGHPPAFAAAPSRSNRREILPTCASPCSWACSFWSSPP